MSDIASFRIASQQDVDSDDQGGVALSVGWVAAGNALQGNEARPGPVRAHTVVQCTHLHRLAQFLFQTCTLTQCDTHSFSYTLHTYTVANPIRAHTVAHIRNFFSFLHSGTLLHLNNYIQNKTQPSPKKQIEHFAD